MRDSNHKYNEILKKERKNKNKLYKNCAKAVFSMSNKVAKDLYMKRRRITRLKKLRSRK